MSQSCAQLKQCRIVQGLRPKGWGLFICANERLQIPIGDYIRWRQPEVAEILCVPLKVVDIRDVRAVLDFEAWQAIMTERPKPGRGGLLPGEVKP